MAKPNALSLSPQTSIKRCLASFALSLTPKPRIGSATHEIFYAGKAPTLREVPARRWLRSDESYPQFEALHQQC